MDPIIEYDHNNRTVVVGGYFYEGKELMELAGSYVFADWSSSFAKGDGTLYMARPAGKVSGKYKRSVSQTDQAEGSTSTFAPLARMTWASSIS